ncbi:hypothetical protein ESOMN_v1c02660 [Williamsoniiplasma somnilux]|uniref:Uncharacterized protein n=1 Tax=Williamsoniiplasma somnilux TaxID=215578 RepID=A0A2K8NZK6_9MOLU|nr:hypothetical protein [Williamsoniiplasma somnilux]ATZ18648.1 hypothetical protein ESOMN_v1c02660 [Williamsoniiplasma somnilux]
MDYSKLIEKFNQEKKGKIIDTKYGPYNLKWKFENFPQILSKPTFLTYISTSLDYQFSALMIDAIEKEIEQIRELFNLTTEAAQRYLTELDFEDKISKVYETLLLELYVILREFINKDFIGWIFDDALRKNTIERGVEYDANLFFAFRKEKLRLDFQKALRKIVKFMFKQMPNDQTFGLLDLQYDKDINDKQLMLKEIKLKALI